MNKLKCAGVALFGLLFSFVITLNGSFAEDCQLQQYASIPIMLDAKDHIFLPASLNGTEFQFTLAIGSPVSSIFRSATTELQLKPAPASGVVQYSIRGETSGSKITVDEMKLGNLAIHNVVFLVD